MKKTLAFALSLSAAASFTASAGAQEAPSVMDLTPIGQATGPARFAPADVTFGHYHLSIMGIDNEIRLAGGRFGDESERGELESGAFMYVVDAMRDWERKYPNDPGIPRALLAVVHVYHKLHNEAAHELAERAAAWLEHDYPASPSATTAHLELERDR